jgi:hypothetical protein
MVAQPKQRGVRLEWDVLIYIPLLTVGVGGIPAFFSGGLTGEDMDGALGWGSRLNDKT